MSLDSLKYLPKRIDEGHKGLRSAGSGIDAITWR
jgi:hypothetical protein